MTNNNNRNQFEEFTDELDSLAEDLIETLLETGVGLIDEVKAANHKQQSPDGKPWKKRQKAYPWPINNKTGKLLNSYKATPNSNTNTIAIQNTAAYAGYVNDVRPLLPDTEVPPKWIEQLDEALEEFCDNWNKK